MESEVRILLMGDNINDVELGIRTSNQLYLQMESKKRIYKST
jgi:hypothetical protein